MERVAIFVDVQNIYYTVKQNYDGFFNYREFWSGVTANRQVVKAIAYAIDRGDEKQIKFQQILATIGFEIKLKPYLQRRDGSRKGDWDVGITLDVLEYAPEVEVVVLGSGDGDFDMLVAKIRAKYQVRVEVYGVPGLTGLSLIKAATQFIPIERDLLLPK